MVEIGSIVDEKVPYIDYIKNERKNKKIINSYKLYLLILAFIFAIFDFFLINDSYISVIITLLSTLAGMEIFTLLAESIKYFLLKPVFISGVCPYCKEEIMIIKEMDKNTLHKSCSVCNGKIEVEVID